MHDPCVPSTRNTRRSIWIGVKPPLRGLLWAWLSLSLALVGEIHAAPPAEDVPTNRPIDFNREIRPILSNACFTCHGPDAAKRKGVTKPLRLDNEAGAFADLGGYSAIVRGNPDESEVIQRIISDDPTEIMPPKSVGKSLTPKEIALLTEWVKQGAPYALHWSYVKPVQPTLPPVNQSDWPRNPIDHFVLARLEREKLRPTQEADRPTLVRRLSLDLTGLPPTVAEVDTFVNDTRPDAYERLVDRLLDKQTFGEHWARMWLDLARYADSAGYADDPARTIWGFRDYVIRSINANKPFDRFTVEQIAGDLLPNPSDEQLIATAFHRNTLTNNEGGTNDEEFRNVAIVDRVNTTLAVWMGTTIACAQCHDHKYDPITQEEYFKIFAFFNNTQDRDRKDESPLISAFSDEQKRRKAELEGNVAKLKVLLQTSSPELAVAQREWEAAFPVDLRWSTLDPSELKAVSAAKFHKLEDQSILVETVGSSRDTYRFKALPVEKSLTALRIEALPHESLPDQGPGHAPGGHFKVARIQATLTPKGEKSPTGRYLRVELPGKQKILSLAEVQVFQGAENIARTGTATQSSTAFDGPPARAIDGQTDGNYEKAKSTTHTATSDDPWWEVDLKSTRPVDRVAIWNRTDGALHTRLDGCRIILLDENRTPVWTETVAKAPRMNAELAVSRTRPVPFVTASTGDPDTAAQASEVLDNKQPALRGWSQGGKAGEPVSLTLLTSSPVAVEEGSTLEVTIEQASRIHKETLGRFRISISSDPRAAEVARTPSSILAILRTPDANRTEAQRTELAGYYRSAVAPALASTRAELAKVEKQLEAMKPETTVPIQRELPAKERRTTHIQLRGNWLSLGQEVTEGVPATFPAIAKQGSLNRLDLARWLVDQDNPLTSRVIANRYWEQIFGGGLVPTSEEFGSQGEPPTHPELLDWLAVELIQSGWDTKGFLKRLVTSATYRQDSRVEPELIERDPDNQLLARGPRFRLSAEMIRDQALAVSGLLSSKMYGPPVKPPQPSMGLNAAFGGGIDWTTSPGDDKYRRGLYTTWRRSNPYPSMATFDAPNREVCIVRRMRTNTPLQALVTLNDPVFVEAAQALARRVEASPGTLTDKVQFAFRTCLSRSPSEAEVERLVRLFEFTRVPFEKDPKRALEMATQPLGAAPKESDMANLAAWTVVGNVLLNLDEALMKR